MSTEKIFEVKITEIEGEVKTHVVINGFSILEILGIRSLIDGLIEDAVDAAEVEDETETEKEDTND
jgi:hypothetical protein